LQNNSALAEIAYKALQQQLELSLQGFQNKNQLLLEQASKKQELENTYYGRYQDVLAQMNTENALAEQIRQFNKEYALALKEFNFKKKQASVRSGGGGSSRSYSSGSKSRDSGPNVDKPRTKKYTGYIPGKETGTERTKAKPVKSGRGGKF
jgi:hypothetical protein